MSYVWVFIHPPFLIAATGDKTATPGGGGGGGDDDKLADKLSEAGDGGVSIETETSNQTEAAQETKKVQ